MSSTAVTPSNTTIISQPPQEEEVLVLSDISSSSMDTHNGTTGTATTTIATTTNNVKKDSNPKDKKKAMDQQEKQKLLLRHLIPHCTPDAKHDDLRRIGDALLVAAAAAAAAASTNSEDEEEVLTAKVLSGGLTNYSYMVYVRNDPSLRLFAKVCFSHACWDPNPSVKFDLSRQQAEFDLMGRFSSASASASASTSTTTTIESQRRQHVAVPYLLLDIDEDTRVLVSQWAPADEQWANQFIEGQVDPRVIQQVATFLAEVTLTPIDSEFNRDSRQSWLDMTAGMWECFADEIFRDAGTTDNENDNDNGKKDPPKDVAVEYAHAMGKPRFLEMIHAFRASERDRRDVLVHGDAHVFNILVEEAKAEDPTTTNQLEFGFGPTGDVFVCDWEQAHAGMPGKDIGSLYAWPMVCAYSLAAKGQIDKAQGIVAAMEDVWEVYSNHLVDKGGKDDAFLVQSFRGAIAWTGFFQFAVFYCMGAFNEFMDFEGLSDCEIQSVKGASGKAGLQFFEWGFLNVEPDRTLDQLRSCFGDIHQTTIQSMAEMASKKSKSRQPRRRQSSMLRESGRRVSDSMVMEQALRRLSQLVSPEVLADIQDEGLGFLQ